MVDDFFVPDPEDLIDFSWQPRPGNPQARKDPKHPPRRFLSIWFRCCHTYGRLYRNRTQTAYEGRCPRCGNSVQAKIGPHGTNKGIFEAR